MDSSRVNSNGERDSNGVRDSNGERDGRAGREENPTPAASMCREYLSHLSQVRERAFRAYDEEQFRSLESSFGSLSVDDSTVRQQNPLLESRWTNRSSPSASASSSSSSLQNQWLNGGGGDVGGGGRSDWYRSLPSQCPYTQEMMNLYYPPRNDHVNGGSYALAGPSSAMLNNGGFMNGDVSHPSRARRWDDFYNGFGSGLINNGSWRSNGGFLNNYHSLESSGTVPIASRARDQHESFKLQRKIDVGSKEAIDVVFNGVISEICDLMVDPYAYQVLEKLMMKCSSEQITKVIDVITQNQTRFVSICIDPLGTLSIQSLLRCLYTEEQILRLVRAISMGALTFTKSNSAKHVILLCFNLFHPSQNRDLLEVIARNCYLIAIDQHGCCMLQQCLGTVCQVVKQRLIHEIITHALKLCVNSFGNYVVQYVVELKERDVTLALLHQLLGNYAHLSRNKYGSHAVQKFLNIQYIDHSLIVWDLIADIDTLVLDPFGNYVIQTAWKVCEDRQDSRLLGYLKMHIERNKPLMRCNMFGNKILEKLNL